MSVAAAMDFFEVARKDRALVEKLIGGKSPIELDKNDIVKAGAAMGYHFNVEDMHNAIEGYMAKYGAELNPKDVEYVMATGPC